MAVTVRDASADDARAIAEVHVAAWRWAYRAQLPDDLLAGLSVDDREAMWAAWFLRPEDRGAMVVACDTGGSVVGFANTGPSRDDDPSQGTGELHALYLVEEVRGTGVGRLLHDEAIVRLRDAGFTHATLWVLETNDLGRRFYEKAGWWRDGAVGRHMFGCGNRPILRYSRDL
jgi:GNAT superfamily N-acetyltransferase